MARIDEFIQAAKVAGGLYLGYQILNLAKTWNRQEVDYSCPGPKSFPAAYYEQAAVDLYTLLFEDIIEDEDAIIAILQTMQTDSDVCELIRVYGLRAPFYRANLSLPVSVSRWLSASDIAQVNQSYAAKGINYRFVSI